MTQASEILLQLSGVGKHFGGLSALSDVSLHIQQGEIYGLIGPNGAGKTTLFNIITGLYVPDQGSFTFAGKSYSSSKPHILAQAGIARTFQNIRLFPNMSALENIMVGRHLRTRNGIWAALTRHASARREELEVSQRAHELLRYAGINRPANTLAKNLSYGEQRRLEIARALATDPKLLALDEPAAGMNATETDSLKTLMQKICDQGITILLIEHDVKLIMDLCDRVAVLDYGKKIAEGLPDTVRNDPDVIAAYIGGGQCMSLLEVHNLKVSYGGIHALKGIDLAVAQGELVALIGSNGAGKTTTLKALAGLLPCTGKVHYDDHSLHNRAAHQRVRDGMALVPEGRGVFGRMSVLENLQMGAYCRKDRTDIEQDLQYVFELFPRLAERRMQLAGTLSGGEQQMVAMARAMMSKPKLLMLDEPSMGLAPLMVEKIFDTIRNISAQGVSILLVEQNAKLALEIAQRGYVMETGNIALTDIATILLGSKAVQSAYLGG